jgi:hypothetical protein
MHPYSLRTLQQYKKKAINDVVWEISMLQTKQINKQPSFILFFQDLNCHNHHSQENLLTIYGTPIGCNHINMYQKQS